MPGDWSLFDSHGKVLVVLARRPDLRLREIAAEVGLTERAVQGVVADLVAAGYLERSRVGRRNRYVIQGDHPLRHPVGGWRRVADLLHVVGPGPGIATEDQAGTALALSCTDHRFQEPLRDLLAAEGLLGRTDVVLWPGGGAALAGRDAARLLEVLVAAAPAESPERVLLLSHEGCRSLRPKRSADSLVGSQALRARRRRGVARVFRAFGVEPEVWFLTERMAYRAKSATAFGSPTTGQEQLVRGEERDGEGTNMDRAQGPR